MTPESRFEKYINEEAENKASEIKRLQKEISRQAAFNFRCFIDSRAFFRRLYRACICRRFA